MSISDFHGKPNVPTTVANLDHNVVAEVLARHSCNVSDSAADLGVPPSDLRRLMWANPGLQDAAFEQVEARLDKAEANILEALHSEDPRRRDAASMFTIRNSHRARRRGWITTSTSVAELSVSTAAQPRAVVFRWRDDNDDKADGDKADAEAQRLRDEGHEVVEIGWSPGETIERDGKAFSLPQYGGDGRADDDCLDGEVAPPAVLIEHMLEVEPAPEPAAVRPA